jgi:catechol 2,3-dioxygenase-like lactoylglutathione lyase family enzyme
VPRFLKVMPRLPVTDLQTAITFYKDLLGFHVGSLWPEHEPSFALLDRDDVCIQFSVVDPSKDEAIGHGTLSFEVDDARAVHADLEGRATIEWGPEVYWYGRREFAIRDPSGYLIIFSEATTDPATCQDEVSDHA